MTLEQQLEKLIISESKKLIDRYHLYHNNLHQEYLRNQKRFGSATKKIKKPDYWSIDNKFNPFYVRRKAKSIAKSVAKSILNQTYKPNQPYIKQIAKDSGGFRNVTIYQIHDAVVSKLFYYRLLHKNKHRFSSFSYAYRHDRNVQFAIEDITVDISDTSRIFIAEFDFSKFFDSISHEYLVKQFNKNGFRITNEEQFIIKVFLDNHNGSGIPQGTSISLFLANLVCWSLDKDFEKEGLRFSRYADDTVVWSPDYNKICNAFTIINKFSSNAGVKINPKKSDGINLLIEEGLPSEFSEPKTYIEFLGYAVYINRVSIKKTSITKIKKQISYLLYKNLILPLKTEQLKNIVIPNKEKDEGFLTAILQIRRYLYGGLTEQYLIDFLRGKTKRIHFKGVMSFYPLVNDEEQLKSLDGWLLSTIYRTLKLRAKLLKSHNHNVDNFFPFNVSKEQLLELCKIQKVGNNQNLLKIPSFILIYKALQKGIISSGIEGTMNPKSNRYHY